MTNSSLIFPNSVIERVSEALSAAVDGELILMVPRQGAYVGLNAVAGVVWDRLERPVVVADLIADLQHDFDGPPALIAEETMALLERMAQLDLIRTAEPDRLRS